MSLLRALVLATLFVLGAVILYGCGTNPITAPDTTERGESNAINPARNVYVVCYENDKNKSDSPVTTNITNNCDKSSKVEVAEGEE